MKDIIKVLRIIFQFIGFLLLRIIYEPLNRVLVDIYGCGCKEGFNCNSINTVVVFFMFAIPLTVSILNIKIYKTRETGLICFILSLFLNMLLFYFIFLSFMWK